MPQSLIFFFFIVAEASTDAAADPIWPGISDDSWAAAGPSDATLGTWVITPDADTVSTKAVATADLAAVADVAAIDLVTGDDISIAASAYC